MSAFTDGSYEAQMDAPHSRDASGWFGATKERNLVVNPKKLSELQVPYAVPTSATGVYWALMTFEPRQVGSEVAPNLQYQIPIIFTIGKNTGAPELRVGSPVAAGDDKGCGIIMSVRNISRAHAVVGASAEVRSALTGSLVAKTSIMDRNIFPGTMRGLAMQLNYKFKDGAYRISGHVDLGTRRLPTVVSEFVVKGGKIAMTTAALMHEQTPVVIEPGGFELQIAPGGQTLKSISIKNLSKNPITIQLEGRNVEQSDTGAIGIGDLEIPSTLAVSIEPKELVINPGVRATARLTVATAPNANGDHWFGISVKERDNPNAFSQQLLAVVTFKNTLKPKVELENMTSRSDRNGSPTQYNFDLHNTGNCDVALFASAKLTPNSGGQDYQMEPLVPNEGKMIPGAKFPGSVTLPPNLAPGMYTMVLTLQFSEKGAIEKRIPVEIKSPAVAKKQ